MARLFAFMISVLLGLTACAGASRVDVEPGITATPSADNVSPTSTDAPRCSGEDVEGGGRLDLLSDDARRTAEMLLEAAATCDAQTLIARANQDGTKLTFGGATPEQMFALPEAGDPRSYELVVRLLGRTTARLDEHGTWVWPALFDSQGNDEQWQEIVDAGLYSSEEVDQMRGQEWGYLGWRLGIDAEGRWLFLVAGD